MYCLQRTTRARDAGSTPLLSMGKLNDDNGGSNRDGKKTHKFRLAKQQLCICITGFLSPFLLSDHDYDVKRPNFTFRQKLKRRRLCFSFPELRYNPLEFKSLE